MGHGGGGHGGHSGHGVFVRRFGVSGGGFCYGCGDESCSCDSPRQFGSERAMSFLDEALDVTPKRKSVFGLDISAATSAASSAVADPGSLASSVQGITSQIGAQLGGSAQQAIAQGQALFNGAQAASHGDYSGLVSAVGGIINDLPPSEFRTVVADTIGIVGAAAKGEEIGAQYGGAYGAIAGAAIGAVIQVVEDILSSPPPPPQGDIYRSGADQICFPPTPNGAPYSVIPGQSNVTPRGNADSIFWQLSTDKDWALQFAFGVTWVRPLGPTGGSQQAAWSLAQWYAATDSVTLANALNPANKPDPNLVIAAKKTALQAGLSLGGPDPAAAAMALLESWYGRRSSFQTLVPFSPKSPGSSAVQSAYGSLKGAWGGGGHNDGVTQGAPGIVAAEFNSKPLDYLYYPILAKWNGSDLASLTPGDQPTAVMMSADTLLLGLSELASQNTHDLVALHYVLGLAWLWKSSRKIDLLSNPNADQNPHPNFMRVAGIIAAKIKADPKRIASVKAARAAKAASSKTAGSLHAAALTPAGHVGHGSVSLSRTLSWMLAAGAGVGLAAVALRKKSR